jgi:hypothetical protein
MEGGARLSGMQSEVPKYFKKEGWWQDDTVKRSEAMADDFCLSFYVISQEKVFKRS